MNESSGKQALTASGLPSVQALLRDGATEQPDVVMTAQEQKKLAEAFIAAIRSRDRQLFESILAEDVVWSLPGTSLVSGDALGVDDILKRSESLAHRGVNIEIQHVVFGLNDIGLLLHNTGEHGGRKLDEHLTTILQLRGGKIHRLDTYISDVEMLNRYFA